MYRLIKEAQLKSICLCNCFSIVSLLLKILLSIIIILASFITGLNVVNVQMPWALHANVGYYKTQC